MWNHFWLDRQKLDAQYKNVPWEPAQSGLSSKIFTEKGLALMRDLETQDLSRPMAKAQLYAWVLDNAPIAVIEEEFFQDHLAHGNLVQQQRGIWISQVQEIISDQADESAQAYALGAWWGSHDFGHTVPDWEAVLELGFPGLLLRLQGSKKELERTTGLTAEQEDFFAAGEMVLEASMRYVQRLSMACRNKAENINIRKDSQQRLLLCADVLESLTLRAPQSLHEALQLAYIYHILQEEVEGERLRSLGGLDRLYTRFYLADRERGVTDQQIKTLLQYFFQKFHALTGDTFYGEPAYIGGLDRDGKSSVTELTWLIIDAYDELNIANPKFHVRLSQKNPDKLVKKICDCIRRGRSSFVFINDECAIPMMMQTGVTLEEAREYVPVGCYEPAIQGLEMGCTGCSSVNMAKALELALLNGLDEQSKKRLGPPTGEAEELSDFSTFLEAVKTQMLHMADKAMDVVCAWEKHYMAMNPSPLLSSTMANCVEAGVDAYAGGAKYNNSSLNAAAIGTVADSLAVIEEWVYTRKEATLPELRDILLKNWAGHETLRSTIMHENKRWGNGDEQVDRLGRIIAHSIAERVNSRPNCRGGRFKAGLFSIDRNFYYGEHTMATADGRLRGEQVSRNLSSSQAIGRNGLTAAIRSVTKLDLKEFPNGSVLDLVLHPSAVAGQDGLEAFAGIVRSYCALGGFALHMNIFDAEVLKKAQDKPEEYANLQVRVCGWNVYFVNLSREEQDTFIMQAAHAEK